MKKSDGIWVSMALVFYLMLFVFLAALSLLGLKIFSSLGSDVRVVDNTEAFPVLKHESTKWNDIHSIKTLDLSKLEELEKQNIYRKVANSQNIDNYLLLADSLEYDCNFSILSYNKVTKEIKLIALPGSMVVLTQGYEYQRLSDVYRYLGIGGSINALNYCYDLDIQRYGFVNFDKLCSNLNRLGTVRVSLTKDEVQILNREIDAPLPERDGKHSLTFEQVVQLINIDFENSRNSEIVSACVERIKSRAMLYTMFNIIADKDSNISTNINIKSIYELSAAAFAQVDEVDYIILPIENGYKIGKLNGKYAQFGDIDKNAHGIDEFLYGSEASLIG